MREGGRVTWHEPMSCVSFAGLHIARGERRGEVRERVCVWGRGGLRGLRSERRREKKESSLLSPGFSPFLYRETDKEKQSHTREEQVVERNLLGLSPLRC